MGDWEESNSKRKRRKIVSTTPENTSSGSGGEKYEVFLSFRGPDTRKAFTDFLFEDLVEKNIRTFRDNEELSVGEEIRPELLKAIEQSKIYIPILSPDYASSKSCLLELARMVGCNKSGGKKIIPVFYDVEPSDVDHQRGSYEEAFRQHEKTRDQKTIQDWKDALKVVAQLKGLSKKDTDGHEGALTKMIVEEVLLELKKNYMHVPELVGMDHHVDKMKGLLNVDSNGVRIVGIHGMGGMGKTTIAKFIYNQLCEDFECCCFLEDIRETSQQKGLVYLQSQLLSRILKGKGRVIDNVDNGIGEIRAAVNRKKVLIVLDDVDEKSQFDKFADNCDFGSGSRIMVTTRNEEVLNGLKVTCEKIGQLEVYQPDLMNPDHSLQVFSKHAFESLSPPKDYDTLSKEVVSYAAGLPLVLVVTGSLLRGEKDKKIWEETSKKLKNIPADEVVERLRISYDPLDNGQKQIFLDIACLFVGKDKTNLLYMWEDCGFYPESGINVLVCRSLIKVGDDNRIWMHDQVRDLGRQIVNEENWNEKGERSRLWHPKEALSILESHTGTNKVVALCLDLPVPKRPGDPPHCLVGKDFKELRNLRYLRLGWADFAGDFKRLFLNLRWLQCSRCPGKFKLTNLGLKNLVVLQLSSGDMTNEWEGWSEIKMATKLKVLEIGNCRGISDSHFYSFETLERLILSNCWELKEIDPLVGNLTKLRVLHLSSCWGLIRVQCSTFATLESLELGGCESLLSLDGLESLKSLTHMDISGCTHLKRLRDLSNLKKLKKLKISGCSELIEIRGLDRLESLESLDMSWCTSIEKLPDLSGLKSLRRIDACNCVKLIEIGGFGELKSLESLHLGGCESIEKLLDLSSLKSLRRIDAYNCVKLTEIGELKSLESLNLGGCKSIEKLPDLSSLKNLTRIDAFGCVKLTEIGGLGELKSLESLNLGGCQSIEKLPDLSSLKGLRRIDAYNCVKLTEIEGLGELKSLESLRLGGCKSIEKLPDLSSLKNLTWIDVFGCVKLTEIGGLGELKSLKSLQLYGCESIEKLPDLSSLQNLRQIHASGCVKLTEIGGLGELKSLGLLDIRGCKLLGNLPCLPNTLELIDGIGRQKSRLILQL